MAVRSNDWLGIISAHTLGNLYASRSEVRWSSGTLSISVCGAISELLVRSCATFGMGQQASAHRVAANESAKNSNYSCGANVETPIKNKSECSYGGADEP